MQAAAILAQASSRGLSVPELFAGGAGLVLLIFLLILSALWFIFPFMVYLKFNELIQLTKRNLEVLEEIERSTRKPTDARASTSTRYSIDEPSSSGGAILGAFGVLVVIVVIVLLVRRQ